MNSTATMETDNNSKNTVIVTVKDILCGRGGHCHQHPGNRLFRAMIKENKGTFEALIHEPMRKQMLVESIIQAIHHHGGRFLRKSEGQWVPISAKEAYIKVCHAFRDIDQYNSSSGSGSESSSMTSDEGKPSSPQHSQFQQALDKKVKKSLAPRPIKKETNDANSNHSNKTKTKTTTTNNNNNNNHNNKNDLVDDQLQSKERSVATRGSDDLPELVACHDDSSKNNNHRRPEYDGMQNKENHKPAAPMDEDIPEVIAVREGSDHDISKNMSFLSSEDGDDEDEDEEDSLRPLDPDEFVFESVEEFSSLCITLLQYWGQGQ